MSGVLGSLARLAADLTSWRNSLRPSSFRGVPFYVDEATGSGGRRKVVNEYPQREVPYIEDLGKLANKFRVRAFVVGDDYLANSDALIAACQDFDTAAILVHPWRGEIRCSAGLVSWTESKDKGGHCAIDIDFHVDPGGLPSPTSEVDTSSRLLASLGSLLQQGLAAYQAISLMVQYPQLLIGFAAGVLGSAAGSLLGLPGGIGDGLESAIALLAASPADDFATATAVQTVFQGAALNAIAAATPPDQPDDPVAGLSPLLTPAADPSGGLAVLTTWGNDLPLPMNPILAAQQGALVGLVQAQAVMAVLAVYASIDWPSSQAATAARVQVQTMLDAQIDLAAAQGQDDLYRGWQAVSALAMRDLIVRAQALPALVEFTTLASMPSLVLAYRWYQDGGRGDELDLLNDVPDPMFMPLAGVRLAA
jgi:hypothetical protein